MKKTPIRALIVTLVAGLFALEAIVGAVAQPQYPPRTPRPTRPPERTERPEPSNRPTDRPPTRTPRENGPPDEDRCLVVEGEVDDDFEVGRVEYQGEVLLQGAQGCARPNGRVDGFAESERVFLGTMTAFEDGSYSGTFALPASVEPGNHTIIAAIEGRGELRRPILVLGTGTTVQGTSQTSTGGSSSGRSGILPRTGAGILLLLLWALVLVGLGTVLVMTAARRGFSLASVRSHVFGRRAAAPRALPPADLPRIDTSRFTPYRSRVDRPHPLSRPSEDASAGTLTEWDLALRSERRS